jgi:hypothetical protein
VTSRYVHLALVSSERERPGPLLQESLKERRFSIAVFFVGDFKSPFLD